MTIEQMHLSFRSIGQMMGMQNVRTAFAESIDICLNFAIIHKARRMVVENATTSNDYIAKFNADISQLNSLRTLFDKKNKTIDSLTGEGTKLNPYSIILDDADVMYYTRFSLSYDGKNTNDCRLLEADYLLRTLDDFCNRPTKKYPACVAININNKLNLELYTGGNNKPTNIIYNYIRKPATVIYNEENSENNVDCDLPEYLHEEIVELAIQYYKSSFNVQTTKN